MLQTYNNGSKLSEANTFQMDQTSVGFRYSVNINKHYMCRLKIGFLYFYSFSYYLSLLTNLAKSSRQRETFLKLSASRCYVAGIVWIVCLMIKVLKHNSSWLRKPENLEQNYFKTKIKYIISITTIIWQFCRCMKW